MFGDGPGGGDGPELDQHVAALGEVVEDAFLGGFGEGVVGPYCVGGGVDGLQDQGRGPVAEF